MVPPQIHLHPCLGLISLRLISRGILLAMPPGLIHFKILSSSLWGGWGTDTLQPQHLQFQHLCPHSSKRWAWNPGVLDPSPPALITRPCSPPRARERTQENLLSALVSVKVPVQTSHPSMDQYSILGRIGEGAHGIVFKAKNIETGETVALKKVALRRLEDGIPNQALREIKALQEIEENQHDLKPANLLISSTGQLKIADFGLARVFSSDAGRLYSHQVATRWYRAPELLYGARKYDEGVDLWAVGCIFAELLNNSPLFPGENDIEQLCCVLRVLGTPSQRIWPEITELPDYNKISFKDNPPIPLEEVLPNAPPQALQLLKHFLVYPSRERVKAAQALLHPYFFTPPLPAHHSELPVPQRGGRTARQGPQHQRDFHVERPVEESVVDPEWVAPYVV
ncbi:cyclin-dependent kinase 20 isoform X2 [Mauremys reevesii]|uniref:cyclin-dependent kinase 20 isoform X2 n=1 Tax=Mauremys reevesii TaxID=260615 RepID=UPI00193F4028|nr:cyclin-dependent kinase 20 isoform X2 [Mauremys reevesii]